MTMLIGGFGAGKKDYVLKELSYCEDDISVDPQDDCPVCFLMPSVLKNFFEQGGLKTCISAMSAGLLAKAFISVLDPLLENKQVLVFRETGCGLLALGKKEQILLEAYGKIAAFYAKKTQRLIRLYCGIPQVLKTQNSV